MDMDSEFTSSIREAADEIKSAAAEVENAVNETFEIPESVDEVQDFTSPASLGVDYESNDSEVKNTAVDSGEKSEVEEKAKDEEAKSGD